MRINVDLSEKVAAAFLHATRNYHVIAHMLGGDGNDCDLYELASETLLYIIKRQTMDFFSGSRAHTSSLVRRARLTQKIDT